MTNKILTKLIILPVLLFFISCNNDLEIQDQNNSYLIKPKNSLVKVDLRLDENKQITSFLITDDAKNFSVMLNLLEDGNCSLKLDTSIYEETVNTNISETSDKYINQYLVLNNKIYLLQEIDNEGRVFSKRKN